MGRPRKFYVVWGEGDAPSRVAHGLEELHKLTGQYTGAGFSSRQRAEEAAAWRDYRYGSPYSVNRPRPSDDRH